MYQLRNTKICIVDYENRNGSTMCNKHNKRIGSSNKLIATSDQGNTKKWTVVHDSLGRYWIVLFLLTKMLWYLSFVTPLLPSSTGDSGLEADV